MENQSEKLDHQVAALLLGPDFHRLDRTSLWLAHLFDHLGGAGEYL